MVLTSNEWVNNCEDDQSSTNTAAVTTAPTETVDSVSPATANNSLPAISSATTAIVSTRQTVEITDNANIEQNRNRDQASIVNANNTFSTIMESENTNDAPLKIAEADRTKGDESDNNNKELDNNSRVTETIPIENCNTNSNSNSTPNSNTNTLQASLNSRQSLQQALKNPITPHALSSALQSVLNSSTSNSIVPTSIQNTLLSALGMGVANNTTNNIASSALQQKESQQDVLRSQNESTEQDLSTTDSNGQARIVLCCEPNSHQFQTRSILLTPNIECKVGRLIAKSKAAETNAIFDCKVLSRNHAVLWFTDDGKFWVKDTKSSNGTFINENKLGTEAAELHFGDIVKFGVDVLENSRKEVHGCIIASVRLYLPDGREAISYDAKAQRSPYSGEDVISYEDMHRLNLFVQETSQREKLLKSKMFNIQNLLDATRKSSTMAWQAMVAEDQLLHRIHSLERKLQLMEKNVPESMLKKEIMQLLDDKSSYQLSAKEALLKVYQERCDALQLLSKVEASYAASDSECKLLRDQIIASKQSIQDLSERLSRMEAEYNQYKEETQRELIEAKEFWEQREAMLVERLLQTDSDCEALKETLHQLKVTDLGKPVDAEVEQLQKQAFANLDAAIGDMDVGDDDEDEDEDAEDENDNEGKAKYEDNKANEKKLNNFDEFNGVLNDEKAIKSSPAVHKKIMPKTIKHSTVMKWLQNSDLNKKEGSLDIFNAICNDSDSSDEQESASPEREVGVVCTRSGEFSSPFMTFSTKLAKVQKNLQQLEEHLVRTESLKTKSAATEESDEESSHDLGYKNFLLLKQSAAIIQETHDYFCLRASNDEQTNANSTKVGQTRKPIKKLDDTLSTLREDDERGDSDDDNLSEATSNRTIDTVVDIFSSDAAEEEQQMQQDRKKLSQSERSELNEKLEATEQDLQQLCETLRVQQDTYERKLAELMLSVDSLRAENQELVQVINENKSNTERTERAMAEAKEDKHVVDQTEIATTSLGNEESKPKLDIANKFTQVVPTTNNDVFELQISEDLATINDVVVQREEELIVYKERLEKTENDNMELRNKVAQLQMPNDFSRLLMRFALPCGVVLAAIFIYFVTTYY